MSFPFRLAAIDLDGTLLTTEHNIPERNARAVRALVDKGVVCVIASGRMHEATTRYHRELGLDTPIISYNGAMTRCPLDETVWQHTPVPAVFAREIVEFCEERGFHLNYYLDNRVYVKKITDWARGYLHQTNSPMVERGELVPLAGSEPTKLILIDSPETTDRLMMEFQERYGDALYITKTDPRYLEFMHPEASKGAALAHVANRLGIAQKETIAFGDSDNDLPMLNWAGAGVAMGNAKPHVRAAADWIAANDEEDGLGAFIEEHINDS